MRELSNLFVRGSLVPTEPDVYLHEHSSRSAARRIMWMSVTADKLALVSHHWRTLLQSSAIMGKSGRGAVTQLLLLPRPREKRAAARSMCY
jgi:hypothetical protein